MEILKFLLALVVLILLIYLFYWLYLWLLRKQSATLVDSDAIRENIRRVQVVDVREGPEHRANHILGSRSIPFSEFKVRYQELRKDTPIYLYDDNMHAASRAARILKKNGYENIHILEGGFDRWTGKVKSEL